MKIFLKIILWILFIDALFLIFFFGILLYFTPFDKIDIIDFSFLLPILFIISFYKLVIKKGNNMLSYKQDYLLYRPVWMLNKNLGVRRLTSLFTNFLLFIFIFTTLIYILLFTINIFSHEAYHTTNYVSDYISDNLIIAFWFQFFSGIIFFIFWGLIEVTYWIVSGFINKKESEW